MATVDLTIKVTPGAITVTPPNPQARRQDPNTGQPDTVRWTCNTDHWAVDFNPVINVGNGQANPHSPFGPNGFHGGPGGPPVGGNVRNNANIEHHRYTVAVWDGSKVRMQDPDLDIV